MRKRGKKSARVSKQHGGTTGHLEQCQVGVFLATASSKGHTLLDREWSLPMGWIEDRTRCREAGTPDAVRFQTTCEQARQMIERLWLANIPFSWVVADTIYGGNADLRAWLEQHGYTSDLAVACNEPIEIHTSEGLTRLTVVKAEARSLLKASCFPRRFPTLICEPGLHRWRLIWPPCKPT
jgi:SRSO17 transposase